jgi:signal recognition particle subunit FFH/SRP54 (srp54)
VKPLIDAFTNLIARIRGLNYIDEATLKEVLREIQRILLRADVSADVVSSITKTIEERFRQERPPEGVTSKEFLVYLLYQELVKALGGEGAPSVDITKRPYKLMLIGVEGSGKTTTAAKLARFYIRRNMRVGLIETDVYRPGAYYQLKQLAEKVNALFYGEENSRDPLSILRHGLEYMQRNKVDLVIIDTAGRHRNEEELLKEARAIYDEAKPDEVMLVIDATIGRQAAAQTERIHEVCPNK